MDFSHWIETIAKDVRYAARQFVRNPLFTSVAVLSLALGIGANTAIFSIFNSVMLRALPVRDPQQMVILTNPNSAGVSIGMSKGERNLMTYAEFEQLRDRNTTMSGLCASQSSMDRWGVRVNGGSPEEANGRLVSENYFSVLGVVPFAGRVFSPEEANAVGKDPYAVISYDYWQRRFGGNTSAMGSTVRINGSTLTVIGVAPPGFNGESVGEKPDIWAPMMMEIALQPGRDWIHEDLSKGLEKVEWLHVFGRLKPGVTIAKAQSEVDVLFRTILENGYPMSLSAATRKEALDQHLILHDARTGAFGGREGFSRQLLILLAVAGVVLLIACANVANLLLARATARSKEVSVRLSLGAARGRLVRQFLTESLLLSSLGGIIGILTALVAARLLLLLLAGDGGRAELSTALDWRVLSFTALVVVVTGVLFGLAPALRGTQVDISGNLKETGRGVTSSGKRITFAKGLVMAQVSLSLVLLVGTGLFLQNLWNLQAAALGYAKENLLVLRVDGVTAGYNSVPLQNLYRDLADRMKSLPGVRGVSYSQNGLFGGTESADEVEVEGFTPQRESERGARFDQIGPGYFATLGVPLLLGREIGLQDTTASPASCVINEAFAKLYFAGRSPVGRRITRVFGDERTTVEVVGVAKDVRDHSIRGDVPPRFYLPIDQGKGEMIPPEATFEIRTSGDPEQVLAAARKAILGVNPDLPITSARSMGEMIDRTNSQPRVIARLFTIFGTLALVLAATGLYGVLSYGVARRTNEIGIRMALGAGKARVIAMILGETGIMIGAGIVVGLIFAAILGRFLANQFYGVSAYDPRTIAIAVCALGFVALIAGYIPALRAARVNPVTALRND